MVTEVKVQHQFKNSQLDYHFQTTFSMVGESGEDLICKLFQNKHCFLSQYLTRLGLNSKSAWSAKRGEGGKLKA